MAVTVAARPGELHAREVREELGLSRENMARLLSVSAKTVENWERADKLPADEDKRTRLAKIAEVAELGLLVYTREGLSRFLQTPLPTFAYRTALQEVELGHVDAVIGTLAAEYEGGGF